MKIPPVAIKSIKPYVRSNHKISSLEGIDIVAIEIELNDKWLKLFKSFKGNIDIRINDDYSSMWWANSSYAIINKIVIKDVSKPISSKYRYIPEIYSKTKFTKSMGIKNKIIKCISRIKLSNTHDIAKLKMLSKSR